MIRDQRGNRILGILFVPSLGFRAVVLFYANLFCVWRRMMGCWYSTTMLFLHHGIRGNARRIVDSTSLYYAACIILYLRFTQLMRV